MRERRGKENNIVLPKEYRLSSRDFSFNSFVVQFSIKSGLRTLGPTVYGLFPSQIVQSMAEEDDIDLKNNGGDFEPWISKARNEKGEVLVTFRFVKLKRSLM